MPPSSKPYSGPGAWLDIVRPDGTTAHAGPRLWMAADSNGMTTTRYRIGRGGVTPDKMPSHKDGIISEGVWLNGGGSLDSKVLSRDHALIIIDGKADVVSVLDRKSTHGTFVKRRGIEYKVSTHSPFVLHTGDVISFGKDVVKGDDRYKASSCRFSRYKPTPKTTSSFAPRALPGAPVLPKSTVSSTTPRMHPYNAPYSSHFASSFASSGPSTGAAAPVLNTPVPPAVARVHTSAWVASHTTPTQPTTTANNTTTTTAPSSSTQAGPRPSGRYGLGRPSSQPHTTSATPRQSTQPNNASQVSPTPPSNDHNLEARTDAQLNKVMASVDSLTAATQAYDKLSAQADKKPAAKDLGRSQSESSASGSSSSSSHGSNAKDVDVKPTAEEKAKAKMDLDKLTTATTKEAVQLSRLETLLRGKANADEAGHGETQPDAAAAAEPATQPIKHTAAYIRHHAQRQSAARRETDEDEQSQDSEDESESSSSDGEDEEADEDEEAEHQRQHLKECYSCRKDAEDEAAAAEMDEDLSSEDQSDDSIESEDDDESDSDDFVKRSHNTAVKNDRTFADGAASSDSIFDGEDDDSDGWDSDASRPPALDNRRLLGLPISRGVEYVRKHREARMKWLRKHPDHVDSESDSDSDSEMDSEQGAKIPNSVAAAFNHTGPETLADFERAAFGEQSGDKTLVEDTSMTLPTATTTTADADESRRSLKRSIDEVEDAGEEEQQQPVQPPRVQQVVEVTHAPRADPKAAGIMDESTDSTTTNSTSSSSVDSSIAGPTTLDTNDVLPVAISRPLAQLATPTKRRRLTPRRDIVVGVAAAFAAGAVGTFVGLAAIGAQYA